MRSHLTPIHTPIHLGEWLARSLLDSGRGLHPKGESRSLRVSHLDCRVLFRIASQIFFSMVCSSGLAWPLVSNGLAQSPSESHRKTRLVHVIQSMEPAVVALFTQTAQGIVSGSGSIIHPEGYVLTNNHVLPAAEGFALLHASRATRFRVVSRFPDADIALIQLDPAMGPFPTLPLGRSHDLMNGESVVVAGNPGGRGIVFTSGIVSANQVLEGGPNALVMASYVNDRRDRFIQFDAASNRGNSGGPLVNMDGEWIGMVVAMVNGEQNVGLAIPIDRVRSIFQRMLQPEMMHRKSVGVRIDPWGPTARVIDVEADSPAAKAGLRDGDELLIVQDQPVRHGLDWWLALEKHLPRATKLSVGFVRDGLRQSLEIVLTEQLPLASVPAENAEPGLRYRFYEGKFSAMPDFSKLEANRHGVTSNLDIERVAQGRPDYFAIVFEGLLKVDTDGLYRIVLVSDDGSKLALHHQEIIDHDGNHPAKPAGDLIRLQKGFHPLRIEYFEGNGEQQLQCALQPVDSRSNVSLESLPWVNESMLFHVP
jgi:S1-C subfamily serine protease